MKKIIIIISLIIVCVSVSGFLYDQLLTQDDVEFQKLDNAGGVALGSTNENEWPWGSYNQWQCFDVAKLSYDCVEYDYGTLVPSLSIETEQEILLFDVYVENKLECDETLTKWHELIDGGNEVCIFAAHMPDVDWDSDEGKPQSLWYLNRVKGVRGYWNLFEESPEFRE